MRPVLTTVVLHMAATLAAALVLTAADSMLAVAGLASVLVLLLWFASLASTDETSGLPLASTSALVGLTLTGRSPSVRLLPLVAGQIVGSVLAGVVMLGLGRLGKAQNLLWDTPPLAYAGIIAVLIGVISAWTSLAIDGGETAAWWAVPMLLSAAALAVPLTASAVPAVLLGLATAGIIGWALALVVAGGSLLGAAIGVYAVAVITPDSSDS